MGFISVFTNIVPVFMDQMALRLEWIKNDLYLVRENCKIKNLLRIVKAVTCIHTNTALLTCSVHYGS